VAENPFVTTFVGPTTEVNFPAMVHTSNAVGTPGIVNVTL
jgi:hypothetical protein